MKKQKNVCVCVGGGGWMGGIKNKHFPLLCRYIFCVIKTKTKYFILNLDITYFVGGGERNKWKPNLVFFSVQIFTQIVILL